MTKSADGSRAASRGGAGAGFTPVRFRQIQAERGAKGGTVSRRGADPNSIAERRPWEALGVSRATWYRYGKPGVFD